MRVPYVITNGGLQIILFGKSFHIPPTVKNYMDIIHAVQTHQDPYVIQDLIDATRRKIANALRLSVSLTYNEGVILHNGKPLEGYAVNKLVTLIHEGREDFQPLANFLTKIQANPLPSVLENLYQFLEHGNMPITDTGDFLAYKAVRSDFKDIHSGTMDNRVGKYVQMPRAKVNPDRNQTCSYGLHVCSFDYLPHFSHANGHVMICQINPADVVAVPADYNNTKMRVAGYWVIGEVENYYAEHKNVLSESEIWDESYFVEGRYHPDLVWEGLAEFKDWVDAYDYAMGVKLPHVRIVDSDGDALLTVKE